MLLVAGGLFFPFQREQSNDNERKCGKLAYCGYINTVLMGEVDQLAELVLGKEGKGSAGEFETVDVMAHTCYDTVNNEGSLP